MSYEDFERLGGKSDIPLKSPVLRRWCIHHDACPDCGERLTRLKHCNACGRDHVEEISVEGLSEKLGLDKLPPPVDRSQQTLTDGSPVTPNHRELRPNGQQKAYVVLSDAERAKGFVRPVRWTYVHEKCGVATTMGRTIAETYARDPHFYSGTFCYGCGKHFPVGDDGEFVWDDGSKVGT